MDVERISVGVVDPVSPPFRGDAGKAAEFTDLAKSFAARWIKEARQGDHFRLAFDQPDTWSQKYNLVWDRILGLNLFPAEVLRES